jgi:hypothetical protein
MKTPKEQEPAGDLREPETAGDPFGTAEVLKLVVQKLASQSLLFGVAVLVVMRCVALMLPLMIDGLGNALHLWNSPGWLRGLTGLGVGLSLPWLLSPLAQSLDRATDPARKLSLKGLRQMLWPALAGASAIMLLDRGCGPMLFRVLAAVAAAGWVLFLGHFILALVRAYGGVITQRLLPLFSRSEVKA